MKKSAIILMVCAVVLVSCSDVNKPSLAPVQEVVDNYYGIEVSDPYRYMENMDDTLFLDWMKEYADYTRSILDGLPDRDSIISKMVDFDSRKSDKVFGLSIAENGKYFYQKMTPGDDYAKLYSRDSLHGEEVLLYDPKSMSDEDGLTYTIYTSIPDHSGEKIGVLLAPNGSENAVMIIIEAESARVLPDRLTSLIGSVSWMKGGKGFFYGRNNSADIHDPARKLDTKVYYHSLGTLQSEDRVVFSSREYPDVGMNPREIPYIIYDNYEDDYYLILSTVERYFKAFRSETGNPVKGEKFAWKSIISQEDQIQDYYVKGNDIYLFTAKDAPGFKLMKTSKKSPDIEHAELVIPEPASGMIGSYAFSADALFYTIVYNGVEEKLYRMLPGEKEGVEIDLPKKAGSLALRTRGHRFQDVWVSISGWSVDGSRYRYSLADNSFVPEQLSSKAEFPEFADLQVEELMIQSHDGVLVPLSIIYKKGLKLNGSAPLLMTGYGAYGISYTPNFSPGALIWTLKGGVLAFAHVRGGGELGDEWRLAGNKTTKANTWKDFIACTEFLQKNKYTSPAHTAVFGGSAGGILIGRAMTDRPDLFAAAIPMVGVMNPLRAEESPNGPVNAPEFGTVKDSVECMALMEMDSYLKLEDGVKYPATLITAGFNDPRVIVWQPAKFAARLQAANGSRKPILFDVDYSSGHGVGDTKSKSFEDFADLIAFALWQTGQTDYRPD